MRDAAVEIGFSDVGLKKVSACHRVPVPPQSYWNKIRPEAIQSHLSRYRRCPAQPDRDRRLAPRT